MENSDTLLCRLFNSLGNLTSEQREVYNRQFGEINGK